MRRLGIAIAVCRACAAGTAARRKSTIGTLMRARLRAVSGRCNSTSGARSFRSSSNVALDEAAGRCEQAVGDCQGAAGEEFGESIKRLVALGSAQGSS